MTYKQIETFRNADNNTPVNFTKLQEGFRITDSTQAKGYKQLGCTDVDGLTEYKGYFLMQEWKGTRDLPIGQKILAENFTKLSPKAYFVQVYGFTDKMEVIAYRVCKEGKWKEWIECEEGIDSFNEMLASWCDYVYNATYKTSKGVH
ncbi:hypothetical protein [Phyllobacterium sophorae]|uniref:Uncharacterized protein n=1 Tax=Phyllobacterium sophorae TaxID=1520277 RepID=A0A2P7BDZ1_9HYPH|nr:hypothetical protein [Phyllobacterium sophorae]PSH64683.1 hypothetical protein CU103_12430 [Phyllobacterium sophorae]